MEVSVLFDECLEGSVIEGNHLFSKMMGRWAVYSHQESGKGHSESIYVDNLAQNRVGVEDACSVAILYISYSIDICLRSFEIEGTSRLSHNKT